VNEPLNSLVMRDTEEILKRSKIIAASDRRVAELILEMKFSSQSFKSDPASISAPIELRHRPAPRRSQ
jgi:hypothetical protein